MGIFQVEPRSGQSKPKQLRKKGIVPMALMERSQGTTLIQARVDELREAMRHVDGHGALEFQIGETPRPRKAILKAVEMDALSRELIHVTFQEVADDDFVKQDVPIRLVGDNEEVGQGLTITQVLDTLKVKARLRDLPDQVSLDVSQLMANQHLDAAAITLPEGVECLTDPTTTVVTMSIVREVETADSADNGEEPSGEAA